MSARAALAFALFALLLVAIAPVQMVGDAHEYVAMATGILAHGSPSPAPAQLDELESRLARHDVPLLRDALHEGRDGRLHFRHFWLYPALAAPAVGLALLAGIHPAWGFALLNIALLSLAVGLLAPRVGRLATLLLFVGPVLWWIDKSHPEAFVFALVAGGFALLPERPGGALLAWGVATAQYPPLVVLLVAATATTLWTQPDKRGERRFLAAAGGAFLFAALQPAHSLWKLGVVSPLVFWGRAPGIPGWRAWSAVYLDLNIGLAANVPLLLLGIAALAIAARSDDESAGEPRTATVVALAAALLLPFAFAQTVNVNHGGTPGISRYALWLIPLAVPLLLAPRGRHTTPRWAALAVAASMAWSVVYFHPGRPESYQQPTRLAAFVWQHAPRLSTPLPEIFAERLTGREPGLLPIATPTCSKVLLLAGRWPAPCAPSSALPDACRAPDALCYANRRGSRQGAYRFRPLRDPLPAAYAENAAVWPRDVEQRVADLLERLDWWEMAGEQTAGDAVLRAAQGVGWTTWLLGNDRFFLYAAAPREGGSVTLRLPAPMSGELVAMSNGARLREVASPPGAGELWNLQLPALGEPGIALVLRAQGTPATR